MQGITILVTDSAFDPLMQLQLSPVTKCKVAVQLCQAVTFMHTNIPPIAHLDIKPSNILVCMSLLERANVDHSNCH